MLRSDEKVKINIEDLKRLISEVDQDKDMVIDYNEFLEMMK